MRFANRTGVRVAIATAATGALAAGALGAPGESPGPPSESPRAASNPD